MRRFILFVIKIALMIVFAVMTTYSLSQTFDANDLSIKQIEVPYVSLVLGFSMSISSVTLLTLVVFVPSGILLALMPNTGFWLAAWMGMALHLPAALAHSQLKWSRFIGIDEIISPGLSQPGTIAIVVSSVIILYVIHRLIGHGKRQELLEKQGAGEFERYQVLRGDVIVTCGMAALSLVVTIAVISISSMLGGAEDLFTRLPWMVLSIGLIVISITTIFLLTWIHVQRGNQDEVVRSIEELLQE